MQPTRHNLRAFALPELLALAAIALFVVAFLCLSAHDARRRSRAAGSIDNLRFFGSGTQAYAADHADKFWTFTWRAGTQSTEYADLNSATSDQQAAANQAVYIIRKYGQGPAMQPFPSWFPHMYYSQLALWEHLGLQLPTRAFVSPEDRETLMLQRVATVRQAYFSSYDLGPAFWSPDAGTSQQPTVSQFGSTSTWIVPSNLNYGRRTMAEVRFPSSKGHVWDTFQRELGGRVTFFAHEAARVNALTVDGSVGLRSAASTNPGFQPNNPTSPDPLVLRYAPGANEPPAQDPSGQDQVFGRMRWTRWGLRGRDFNGSEVTAP